MKAAQVEAKKGGYVKAGCGSICTCSAVAEAGNEREVAMRCGKTELLVRSCYASVKAAPTTMDRRAVKTARTMEA